MKIFSIPEARADLVANQAELAWSTRNLLPNKIIIDRDNELLIRIMSMMVNDYGN